MEYRTVDFGGLSAAVCQVDSQPALFPPTCWTSSSPFWEVFVARKGGAWTWSSLGMSAQVFHDGDTEGFRYEAQSDQLPPKILGNCPTSTPAPTTTPKPTPRPTPRATPSAAAGTSAGPTPSASLGAGTLSTAPTSAEPAPPGPSPSAPPVGDVAGATSSAAPSSDTAAAGSAAPPPGSGDGSPGLPIAIVAIACLAALAALRRRPGRPGPTR